MAPGSRHALVVRHVLSEDLGAWCARLLSAGFNIEYLEAGVGTFDRDPLAPDLLIVLGGPIGAYETERFPFLKGEIAFIAKRLAAGAPTLGVCLGAQLLAAAAGAKVFAANTHEIGFLPITLTKAGRASCLAPFADEPLTLHWHGDTFDLPPGAELLASTVAVKHQAFAIGPRVLAVQFHPEWGAAPFEPWLIANSGELKEKDIDVATLRADAERLRPALASKAERVLEAYLAGAGLA